VPEEVKTDGLSLAGFLKGGPAPKRDYFYWELHEGRSIQAVRFGDWKAVRNGPSAAIELYNLAKDAGETNNIADSNPELVSKAAKLMKEARTDGPNWPLRERRKKPAAKGKKK
jgi:arylsulfatase A-like enzyme